MNKNESQSISIIKVVVLTVLLLCIGSAAGLFAQTKIMCLGDSITAGQGCWRAYLWNALQTNGYTNIDFVGSVVSGGCLVEFDTDCEGHGGYSATGIANDNLLPPWLSAANPDIVVMHLGTNDMWGGYIPLADKLTAFTTLINQMRTNNPNMKIIVAQIIPMSESACSTCPADVITLNNAIPGWASGMTTSQSPITVVDQWTGFDAIADTKDGVHPNDSGEHKMADKWYPALISFLSGGTVTLEPTAMVTVAPDTPAPTDAPTADPTVDPATLAPTDTPTDTPAPTATPGPTSVPTATPVGGTDTSAPTDAATDAPVITDVPTNAPVVTDTPTTEPSVTTDPGSCACTCPNLCSSTTAVTIPFTFDGAGEYCWTSSSLGTYVNSWNSDAVNINGTSCANTYVSSSTIAALCGVYYIYYKASYSWSHIEIK